MDWFCCDVWNWKPWPLPADIGVKPVFFCPFKPSLGSQDTDVRPIWVSLEMLTEPITNLWSVSPTNGNFRVFVSVCFFHVRGVLVWWTAVRQSKWCKRLFSHASGKCLHGVYRPAGRCIAKLLCSRDPLMIPLRCENVMASVGEWFMCRQGPKAQHEWSEWNSHLEDEPQKNVFFVHHWA